MSKEEFAPIPKCLTCVNQCKKYIALFLLEAFEQGTSDLYCSKYVKIKEVKEPKEPKIRKKKGVTK